MLGNIPTSNITSWIPCWNHEFVNIIYLCSCLGAFNILYMMAFQISICYPRCHVWFQDVIRYAISDFRMTSGMLIMVSTCYTMLFQISIVSLMLLMISGVSAKMRLLIARCHPNCHVWVQDYIRDVISDFRMFSKMLVWITPGFVTTHNGWNWNNKPGD